MSEAAAKRITPEDLQKLLAQETVKYIEENRKEIIKRVQKKLRSEKKD